LLHLTTEGRSDLHYPNTYRPPYFSSSSVLSKW